MSNRRDFFFIYPKDSKGNLTGNVICVILREGRMYHGEAICSPKDKFNKKFGRELAYKRALEASDKFKPKE